jgi:hypothetical protein
MTKTPNKPQIAPKKRPVGRPKKFRTTMPRDDAGVPRSTYYWRKKREQAKTATEEK